VGESGRCTGSHCPFWAEATEGRAGCIFEEVDLRGREQLARWLLDLRRDLEEGDEDVRSRFFARLNAGRSD